MLQTCLKVFFIGYLLGSFPSGYLAGRLRGVDIRKHGSGNIGATNVLRILGREWGLAVFLVDALKGFIAVRLTLLLIAQDPAAVAFSDFFAILAAAACVFGHSFPIWLRFKGGKGVATSVGSILGVMPVAALSIFSVWLTVFLITRYVSLASIIGAIALPVTVAIMGWLRMTHGFVLLYFSIAMAALVVWRHRENMVRLLNGTERRFVRN